MYSSILVAIDLDEPSSWNKAVPTALALGRCFDAKMALVYVVPETLLALQAQWSSLSMRRILDDNHTRLMTLAAEWDTDLTIEKHVTSGSIYGGILEIAEQTVCDLIVLATHRPQMKDYLLGANASRVVRHARCSVMVVRN